MQGLATALCALALLAGSTARAQEIVLDFRGADLASVVDSIARATGQRFLYDDSLRGNVTISVPQRATREEALRVLEAALLLQGFAALPAPGGVRKIVRIEGASGGVPWLEHAPRSGSEAAVVTLIRLSSAPATEIAQALRGLLGKGGVLVDDPRTNSLLIAASEAQMRRLLHLARALDQRSERELRVLSLRYRDAAELEPALEEALAGDAALGEPVRVISDPRTASLVIEGRRQDLERARALLRALDVPQPGKGNLHVVRVRNADAEKLSESLQSILEGGELGGDPEAEPARVAVDPPTHSLLIQATPGQFAALARVIAELDVVPPRVSVELAVVEVSLTGDLSLGLDALLPLGEVPDDVPEFEDDGAAVVAIGQPANVDPGAEPDETFVARVLTDPLLVAFADTPVQVALGAVVRAEKSEATFHTLMRPHLLMASGEEHRIQAGDNIPVPISSPAAAVATDAAPAPRRGGLTTEVTFQRQDTGIDLRMTPTVLSEHAVSLVMELSVSEVASTSVDLGPTLTTRELTATVRLRDGQVALIGALRAPQRTQIATGVPFLGRIPVLGQLFTNRREVMERKALIITAQPTVLGSLEEERARAIRQRLAFERHAARTRELPRMAGFPYALLIDTRRSAAAALELAAAVRDPRWQVQIVRWTADGEPRWDVYATGLATLGEAGSAAIALRDAGWQPALTVLPHALE